MESRDKKLLLIGVVVGMVIAAAVMTTFYLRSDNAKAAMQGQDREAIQRATHDLNGATKHLAEVMMNRSVREALTGRSVDSV